MHIDKEEIYECGLDWKIVHEELGQVGCGISNLVVQNRLIIINKMKWTLTLPGPGKGG